jgi:predicted acetyltransferase
LVRIGQPGKVISANGGTLESEYSVPEYDGLLQRYVIPVLAAAE